MLEHFAISLPGTRHITAGIVCQDASASARISLDKCGLDVVIAVAADGVSSASCPERGAQHAAQAFVDKMSGWLAECDALTDENVPELMRRAYEDILDEIEEMATREEMPLPEYDCTLCTSVFDGTNLWFGQVGDSGIVCVYSDGTYEMCTSRQTGEIAHSLHPLCHRDYWVFARAPKPVAAYAVMTDGVLDSIVGGEVFHNRVEYSRIIGPALVENIMHSDEDAAAMRTEWTAFLNEEGDYRDYLFRTGGQRHEAVTDDITLVVVQNDEAIAALPPIVFDQGAFDEETVRINKEIAASLAASAQAAAEAYNRKQSARASMAGHPGRSRVSAQGTAAGWGNASAGNPAVCGSPAAANTAAGHAKAQQGTVAATGQRANTHGQAGMGSTQNPYRATRPLYDSQGQPLDEEFIADVSRSVARGFNRIAGVAMRGLGSLMQDVGDRMQEDAEASRDDLMARDGAYRAAPDAGQTSFVDPPAAHPIMPVEDDAAGNPAAGETTTAE